MFFPYLLGLTVSNDHLAILNSGWFSHRFFDAGDLPIVSPAVPGILGRHPTPGKSPGLGLGETPIRLQACALIEIGLAMKGSTWLWMKMDDLEVS